MRSASILAATLSAAALAAAPRAGPQGEVLGRQGIRHAGGITEAQFSPDGRLLATCSASPHVRLWRLPDAAPAGEFDVGTDWLLDLSWSPGGDALAVAGSDASVTVYEVATGARLYRNRSHLGEAQRVAFLPDGRLASGGRTGLVLLHDLSTGNTEALRAPEVPQAETGEGPDYSRSITDLVATPDGAHLLVGDASGTLHVWDLEDRARVKRLDDVAPGRLTLRPGAAEVLVLRLDPGDEVAHTGSLELLSVPALETRARLRRGAGGVLSAAFTPDGATLLLGSHGGLERLPLDGTPGRTSALPDFVPVRLSASADGQWLALGGGPEVRLRALGTGAPSVVSDGHSYGLSGLVADRTGVLNSTGVHHEYKRWDLQAGVLIESHAVVQTYAYPRQHQVNEIPTPLARATPTQDGKLLLFTGPNTLERRDSGRVFGTGLWDADSGTCVTAAADVDLAALGDEQGRVQLLRPSSPRKGLRPVRGDHDARVTALSLAPSGTLGMSGGQDTRVRRIDVRGRRSVALPAAHLGPVVDVEVGRGGKLGASGAQDRSVVLWDLAEGRARATLGADTLDLTGWVALSPDSEVLAATTTEGAVRLYAVAGGQARVELPLGVGEAGPVHFVARTGELVAAAGSGIIHRWPRRRWRAAFDGRPPPLR